MEFVVHKKEKSKIVELKKDSYKIESTQDALDLMASASYHGSTIHIIHSEDIHPDFFELKTGLAGEILQKYSNYNNRLAIIGDFSNISSKSLKDFIYESNKGSQINFTASVDEAISKFEN